MNRKKSCVSKIIAELICSTNWSNRKIGAMSGCSNRTVGLYRKIITDKKYSWSYLKSMSRNEIQALFSKRRAKSIFKRLPNFEQIKEDLKNSNTSLRRLWETYHDKYPKTAISFSHFVSEYQRELKNGSE
ncbi:hypothetical protein [Kangiella sp. TOML190]|uniref:hypothetical protein n=1 Tax=Kangiella sp. TOML190 TaxID=2931351 RepID=UPI00203E6F22|nr:hypothetical protein [Kangiella sp. TOML190]